MLYIFTVLSFCWFAPSAYAQKAKKLETAALSVQYPDGWTADSTRLNINGTVRLAPVNNTAGTLGSEVVIEFRPMEKNLDAMIKDAESSVKNGGEMLKGRVSTLQLDGAPAYKTVMQLGPLYTITTQVVSKNKLCRITCFTTAEQPEELQKDFDLIVNSIRFK